MYPFDSIIALPTSKLTKTGLSEAKMYIYVKKRRAYNFVDEKSSNYIVILNIQMFQIPQPLMSVATCC